MRINVFLAAAGFGSRRSVEQYVTNGEVEVDGKIITDLATQIDPSMNIVKVAGRPVVLPNEHIYIAFNKPLGIITSTQDPYHKHTVFDFLPPFHRRIFPVGRLDKNSEGLLFLTSDGEFADSILHPKYKLAKTYKVEVQGKVRRESLQTLRQGVNLEDGITLPAKVFIDNVRENTTVLKITIFEGRKRQVRRMCKSVGNPVVKLKRLKIGPVMLGNLKPGHFRFLTKIERKKINRMTQEA